MKKLLAMFGYVLFTIGICTMALMFSVPILMMCFFKWCVDQVEGDQKEYL